MPICVATSRNVRPARPFSCAIVHASSRISARVASRRSVCLSRVGVPNIVRRMSDGRRLVKAHSAADPPSDHESCAFLAGQAKLAAVAAQDTRPRLAELVGVAARACDVGIGLTIENTIRTCLVSVELGRRIGLSTGDLADLYYLSLLRMLGCTAGSAEAADLFSDEVKFGTDTQHLDY